MSNIQPQTAGTSAVLLNAALSQTLLPASASPLEKRLAVTGSAIVNVPTPIRTIWQPATCPAPFLPYLAWAVSVDRWDPNWPESVKRKVIHESFFLHKHKGTIASLRKAVEPFGYLIKITEWWESGKTPGTFELEVGVLDSGITEETYLELTRMISDTRPVSRHLTGLKISAETRGTCYLPAATVDGETVSVYPFSPELVSTSQNVYSANATHHIEFIHLHPLN